MILTQVRLRNFRNHAESRFEFGEGINALVGNNGEGKTNVLEAISYLGLTKSFYASADVQALQIGKPFFDVEGTIVSAGEHSYTVRVVYARDTGEKVFTMNNNRPETLASVIGQFPLVVLSPENSAVTFGGPSERRKFLDVLLSQASPVYLEELFEFRRVLRQRNRILADSRVRRSDPAGLIEPWDISLIRHGSRIIHRRLAFVREFRAYIGSAYRQLVTQPEEPGMAYAWAYEGEGEPSIEEVAEHLQRKLAASRDEERSRGMTLVGPHRDELQLTIDGISAVQFASQGQHKTLLVALKVAEFYYLRERKGESPLFLLDDVLSELDTERAGHILDLVGTLGQTVITTADEGSFRGRIAWKERHRRFRIYHGTVSPL